MSNGEDEMVFQKAPLLPKEWYVECPCCGANVDVPEVMDDDSGVHHALNEHCLVVCEECQTGIEPMGVRLVHTDEPFWRPA